MMKSRLYDTGNGIVVSPAYLAELLNEQPVVIYQRIKRKVIETVAVLAPTRVVPLREAIRLVGATNPEKAKELAQLAENWRNEPISESA